MEIGFTTPHRTKTTLHADRWQQEEIMTLAYLSSALMAAHQLLMFVVPSEFLFRN